MQQLKVPLNLKLGGLIFSAAATGKVSLLFFIVLPHWDIVDLCSSLMVYSKTTTHEHIVTPVISIVWSESVMCKEKAGVPPFMDLILSPNFRLPILIRKINCDKLKLDLSSTCCSKQCIKTVSIAKSGNPMSEVFLPNCVSMTSWSHLDLFLNHLLSLSCWNERHVNLLPSWCIFISFTFKHFNLLFAMGGGTLISIIRCLLLQQNCSDIRKRYFLTSEDWYRHTLCMGWQKGSYGVPYDGFPLAT